MMMPRLAEMICMKLNYCGSYVVLGLIRRALVRERKKNKGPHRGAEHVVVMP